MTTPRPTVATASRSPAPIEHMTVPGHTMPPSTRSPAPTPIVITPGPVAMLPQSRESSPVPVVDMPEPMDPLSHLSEIFEKIKKQVIEWGEDANWKIDVFLLPNEDGSIPDGDAPAQAGPLGRSSQDVAPVAPPRMGLTDIPRPPGRDIQDVEMRHAPSLSRFELQPPPNDLPMSMDEPMVASLREQDIANMSESEARQMLSLAVRQLREQQMALSHAIQDVESMQRVAAKKEMDYEARLEAEKRNMGRENMVLSKKWKDASYLLLEKDRELRDIQMQLEAGKRYVRERTEERRKRFEEFGMSFPRTAPGRDGIGLAHSSSMPSLPTRTEPIQPPFHQHRHRRVHYHRHHHRHLTRRRGVGTDSLENLALLATQALSSEPLVISNESNNNGDSSSTLIPPTASSGLILSADYTSRLEKKRISPGERDQGLQLRPVKRVGLNPPEGEDVSSIGGSGSSPAAKSNGGTGTGMRATISNGRSSLGSFTRKPQQRIPSQQTSRLSPSSRSSGTSAFQHNAFAKSSPSGSRTDLSAAAGKDASSRTASTKFRRS
ncbi:hypothetical protein BGZ54_003340 [Gamsiella multidivaricata]|nr:hypothetical protein BGZ54_003340 [Gamsiella multidivaricata]